MAVLKFRKRKPVTIRGESHQLLAEACNSVDKPVGTVVVVFGTDGHYAVRSAWEDGQLPPVDMYNRAAQLMRRSADGFLE